MILWCCVVDINDCVLCNIIVGFGLRVDGVFCEIGFDIIVVSEVGVILFLVIFLFDLCVCLGCIVIGYNCFKELVSVEDLYVVGLMVVIFKDVFKLNLL